MDIGMETFMRSLLFLGHITLASVISCTLLYCDYIRYIGKFPDSRHKKLLPKFFRFEYYHRKIFTILGISLVLISFPFILYYT